MYYSIFYIGDDKSSIGNGKSSIGIQNGTNLGQKFEKKALLFPDGGNIAQAFGYLIDTSIIHPKIYSIS